MTTDDGGGHPPIFHQKLLTDYAGEDDTEETFDRRATIRGFAFNILIQEGYARNA